MRHILLAALCLLPLLLAACVGPGTAGPTGTFASIQLYHSVMGAGLYEVQISAAGDMTVRIERGSGDVQRGSAHLAPEQKSALVSAFRGWRQLKPAYPGDWTILIQITYDRYMVEVHDPQQAPEGFLKAKALLDDLANQALRASTMPSPSLSPAAPAAVPASRP